MIDEARLDAIIWRGNASYDEAIEIHKLFRLGLKTKSTLCLIAAMCGTPSAEDACRNILDKCKEALSALPKEE